MKGFKASCVLLALGAAACQESVGPTGETFARSADFTTAVSAATGEEVTICKEGPAGTYDFTVAANGTINGGNDIIGATTVDAGQCRTVIIQGGTIQQVTITELSHSGTQLDNVVVYPFSGGAGAPYNTGNPAVVNVGGGPPSTGAVVVFYNSLVPPPPPPPSGCTFTIGYWKTHDGSKKNGVQTPTLLPVLLGTFGGAKTVNVDNIALAVSLLGKAGDASNGINKLYAQLLGAKLSIKNGASDAAVAGLIATADTFLATHNAADWTSLSAAEKQMVIDWASTLDSYNNGLIGPGHCSE